jgi:hypothetical protein
VVPLIQHPRHPLDLVQSFLWVAVPIVIGGVAIWAVWASLEIVSPVSRASANGFGDYWLCTIEPGDATEAAS